jgi:OOP family OmpA-OmpF porin
MADETFDELRSLLIGPEQRELLALQAQLDEAGRARDVSRVLPEAIALRGNDAPLTRALAPSVEDAITASVRRNPQPLADALFPVMGPAIRKAIAHTLASMMESLNRSVEHSLSMRAVQWRWTAFRTGTPFSQIVLLNTLQYRVEQVFLIHRETGLLLQHVALDVRTAEDADQISGMLTAIRDFVSDSFHTKDGDSLDAMRVGDLTVVVEGGPHASIAAVIRGTAPYTLRAVLQEALETIHLRLGKDLDRFSGDAAPFEPARPLLESCLVTQYLQRPRGTARRRWIFASAAVLLVIGIWAGLRVRDGLRWNAYIDRLATEPGIVVLSSGRRGGQYFVTGLRDPLAGDPATHLAAAGLSPGDVESRWVPYEGHEPGFVIARAENLLKPPAGVALGYADGVLTARGPASERWIVESERLAPTLSGVRRFAHAGPAPRAALAAQLENSAVRFERGLSRVTPAQMEELRRIVELLEALNEAVRARGERARVEVGGHTDADGSEAANMPLSEARTGAVLRQLDPRRFDSLDFIPRAFGSTVPLTVGTTGHEKEQNRRVSFRVQFTGAARPGGLP